MKLDIQFRGERWQLSPLAQGAQYATTAHNMYRRNQTLEPLRRNEKSTVLPDADFQFARSFYLHDDKLVATENRLDFATTQVIGDKSRRMYFVENNLLQFLAYNEIPEFGVDANPYPTPTINGHRSGVPAPVTLYAGPVGTDEVYGLNALSLIRPQADHADTGDGTLVEYEDLEADEQRAYVETAYVYTYVNKYGEEGPPSNPSNVVFVRSDYTSVQLTGMEFSDNPDIVGIRVYALVNGDFYLVGASNTLIGETATTAAIPSITILNNTAGGAVGVRTVTFSSESVKTQLISETWYQAPDDVKHLAELDGGILAVASDHTLRLSVRYHWHAFPVDQEYQFHGTIQRIARINGGIAIMTDRDTHIYHGVDPAGFYPSSVPAPYPIKDPDSLCVIDDGIGYVGNDGFIVVAGNGGEVVTDSWIDRREWLTHISVDECRTELYEGKVLIATRNPENGDPIGYCLNMAEGEITSFDIDEVALNAGFFRDPRSNEVHYVIDDTGLAMFDRGDLHVAIWESGDIIMPKFHSFNTVLVEADEYPSDGSLKVTIILPNGDECERIIDCNLPIRVQPTDRHGRFRVRIESGKNVALLRLATGMDYV